MSFHAVYRPIVEGADLGATITRLALSGDGRTVWVAGWADARRAAVLSRIDFEGARGQPIDLPDLDGAGIQALITDGNGSRAFFVAHRPGLASRLWKVEGGRVALALDPSAVKPPLPTVQQIQCTADGQAVYFLEAQGYSGDVWKIAHDGNGLAKVIEDTEVIRDDLHGGKGYRFTDFALSDDGDAIAFVLEGEFDPKDIHVRHNKPEVHLHVSGTIRRLTDDEKPTQKTHVAISGDGGTVVYCATGPQSQWIALHDGGRRRIELGSPGFNFAGLALSWDGGVLCHADDAAWSGQLTYTDGSGRHGLFPRQRGGYRLAAIGATGGIPMSDAADRIVFSIHNRLYAGQVGQVGQTASPGAMPSIESVTLEPLPPTRQDPALRATVAVKASHPKGPGAIDRVFIDPLLDGAIERDGSKLRYSCPWDPVDNGQAGDAKADDGVFTALLRETGKMPSSAGASLRVTVVDKAGVFSVADVPILGGRTDGPRPPLLAEPKWALSAEQKDAIREHGYPDSFGIMGLVRDEEATAELSRLELWTYHGEKLVLVFHDGKLEGERPLSDAPPEVAEAARRYRPEHFAIGMEWRSVQRDVVGLADDPGFSVPSNIGYYGVEHTGLRLGFEAGKLVYVDTAPDVPDTSEDLQE